MARAQPRLRPRPLAPVRLGWPGLHLPSPRRRALLTSAPDPSRGLFETLLAHDGRPVRAGVHLDRLAGSARELYGRELPAELPDAIDEAARPLELGRIRIDLLPDGEAFRFEIAAEPIDPAIFFPAKEDGADLRTVTHRDYLGGHKLADRDWLEGVEAELGETVPLILTPDDEVLEAGRANIFLVSDGGLATPAADGRILPGTARRSVLELAADLEVEVAERPLHLDDLKAADDLFLTSSLRGIRPVRSLDGEPTGDTDPLVERLAGELRRRWLDQGSGSGAETGD